MARCPSGSRPGGWAGLALALALGLVCGLLFGLAPAWQLARLDPQRALREGRALPAAPVAHTLMACRRRWPFSS